ncbi:DUF1116 domain-containing protein [Pusillimonas sp.]|uniref:oxamate carbamoyltransferase subunit AllG family protein n=1 Tax=Pusillimonas sp. TaxID=3040095 RepID=UPI0037C9ED8A
MSNEARLIRLVRLEDAVSNLPARTLFHAGPPYKGQPPGAVLNAAAHAAVLEGWSPDFDAARSAIAGEGAGIRLLPAQDHGIVVPLAQVAGPSTWCWEVGNDKLRVYSPVSEGGPPALRFGSADPRSRDNALGWCAKLAEHANPLLEKTAIHPEQLMRKAHEMGDDGHAVVQAGTGLLVDALEGLPEEFRAAILANAGFALTPWMAYCGWKLGTNENGISAIGGNGIEFGIKLKGNDTWNSVSAPSPSGPYFKPEFADESLGAIGDSAVVDTCGFGGQALQHAPVLLKEWNDYLPADVAERPKQLLDPQTGCLDPARIVATGMSPIINLAILHREGADTPIGRGHYCPPASLFDNKG